MLPSQKNEKVPARSSVDAAGPIFFVFTSGIRFNYLVGGASGKTGEGRGPTKLDTGALVARAPALSFPSIPDCSETQHRASVPTQPGRPRGL